MPITIKSTEMKYKNPTTGLYQGIDAIAETSFSELSNTVIKNNLPVNPALRECRMWAHQGGWSFVQSTDKCFRYALQQGFKVLEADLKKTSDNQFVIFHDHVVGSLTIENSTLAEVLAVTLDYGCKVMSLTQFMKMCVENNAVAIFDMGHAHISDEDFLTYGQAIYDEIKAINPSLDSVGFALSHNRFIHMESIDPTVILLYSGLTAETTLDADVNRIAAKSRFFIGIQSITDISSAVVSWIKANNYHLEVYTCTTTAQMYSAFAAGADFCIVNGLLPKSRQQAVIGLSDVMENWIYSNRMTLSDTGIVNSYRVINANMASMVVHGVISSNLAASDKTIMELPDVFGPYSGMGTYIGTAYYGADADHLGSTCPASITASTPKRLNVVHGGGLTAGTHVVVYILFQINPFVSIFPSLT